MDITALKISRTVYPLRPQFNFRKWRRWIQIERIVNKERIEEMERNEKDKSNR